MRDRRHARGHRDWLTLVETAEWREDSKQARETLACSASKTTSERTTEMHIQSQRPLAKGTMGGSVLVVACEQVLSSPPASVCLSCSHPLLASCPSGEDEDGQREAVA